MVKKHVEITAEDVEFIDQAKRQRPELSNFSAALRWVLLNARKEGGYGDQMADVQQRMADLKVGQLLTNQLLASTGASLAVQGDVVAAKQPFYQEAKRIAEQQATTFEMEREVAEVKPESARNKLGHSELGFSHRSVSL